MSAWHSKVFIATAEPFDVEMKKRVVDHRKERGPDWHTIEESCDLATVIGNLGDNTVAVLDCCTVWLGNVWHTLGDDDSTLENHIGAFCAALAKWSHENHGEIMVVSNEVGWGIVPHEEAVRRYRDWAGRLNQRIASIASAQPWNYSNASFSRGRLHV